MKIISRKEAKELGLKRYFTGEPCKHGHVAERNISNCICLDCSALKSKNWRKRNTDKVKKLNKKYGIKYRIENKEKLQKYHKEYHIKNRERKCAKTKEWRINNLDKKRKYDREYRIKNAGAIDERVKEWIKNNTEKRKRIANKWSHNNLSYRAEKCAERRAAKLNATPNWLTQDQLDDIELLYMEAAERTEKEGIQYHVDHIVPLQGKNVTGLHVAWNMRVIPASENLSKSNKLLDI